MQLMQGVNLRYWIDSGSQVDKPGTYDLVADRLLPEKEMGIVLI